MTDGEIINRQKAEIEKLNIELKAMRGSANSYKAEVERLQSERQVIKDNCDKAIVLLGEVKESFAKDLSRAKSEAIKEFAKSLKTEYADFDELHEEIRYDNLILSIDNLVKEMTEE